MTIPEGEREIKVLDKVDALVAGAEVVGCMTDVAAMKPKVFVTRKIPEAGLNILEKKCEVKVNPDDQVLTKEELIEKVKEIDGLLCLLADIIDEKIININPRLKIISNYAVGYNNIDIKGVPPKTFVFPEEVCKVCPRRNECTNAKNSKRTIRTGPNEEYLQKSRKN